jgi:hypothetical protein
MKALTFCRMRLILYASRTYLPMRKEPSDIPPVTEFGGLVSWLLNRTFFLCLVIAVLVFVPSPRKIRRDMVLRYGTAGTGMVKVWRSDGGECHANINYQLEPNYAPNYMITTSKAVCEALEGKDERLEKIHFMADGPFREMVELDTPLGEVPNVHPVSVARGMVFEWYLVPLGLGLLAGLGQWVHRKSDSCRRLVEYLKTPL